MDILTNPVRVTLTKKVTFSGKISRGTIKWVTRLLINKKGRGKREGERKFEIDSQRKDQILAFVHALKTNKLFNYVRLL